MCEREGRGECSYGGGETGRVGARARGVGVPICGVHAGLRAGIERRRRRETFVGRRCRRRFALVKFRRKLLFYHEKGMTHE